MEYYRIKQKGYFRRYKYYINIKFQQVKIQTLKLKSSTLSSNFKQK